MRDCALVEMKHPLCAEPWVVLEYKANKEVRELIRFATEDKAKAYLFDILHGER